MVSAQDAATLHVWSMTYGRTVVAFFCASKKPVEVLRRSERGRHAWKDAELRKVAKKEGQEEVVKFVPKTVLP
jgi:hypothetical protein